MSETPAHRDTSRRPDLEAIRQRAAHFDGDTVMYGPADRDALLAEVDRLIRQREEARGDRDDVRLVEGGSALVVPDSPQMLRETLCVAAARISDSLDGRRAEHVVRLQRLIAECDRHRPLGPDGKHGDLHTATCECEDTPATSHTPEPKRPAVEAIRTRCDAARDMLQEMRRERDAARAERDQFREQRDQLAAEAEDEEDDDSLPDATGVDAAARVVCGRAGCQAIRLGTPACDEHRATAWQALLTAVCTAEPVEDDQEEGGDQ
ncbi:hypothetical protein FHX37_0465 [Haloactinospora alba]|uniref:Uncharacterized protein n=1 Tax=Haloactinospora alba TaxID=405555 RepID=A0A543NFG5_9ACTN|nr:hypothetical protein [Haloactinospora alba]TQN30583.1 hypothetical protein FHX37_0465 [Haloactinospora alba]